MELNIKLTANTEDVLNLYDVQKLLTQGLDNALTLADYLETQKDILPKILNMYSRRANLQISSNICLSDDIYETLMAFSDNYNVQLPVLFNYLITNVCNCGKINTKKVDAALDFYYNAANSNKELYRKILNGYSDSVYYNEERGLDEEDVVAFLINTDEGKALINN